MATVVLLLSATTGLASPHSDYMLNCMGCHLADGAGAPSAGIPRFAGRIGYYLGTAEGRAYLAQVPGAADSPLDDRALAAVLNWIVEYFAGESMPPDFNPYDAAEVGRYRSNRPVEIDALRERLTAEIYARYRR
jgi:cytochrome c553